MQVANQDAKVVTQRNIATFTETIAVRLSGAFMFFRLLRTACVVSLVGRSGFFGFLIVGV